MGSLVGGWLLRAQRREMACVRVVAFPPAGAGPGWFGSWRNVLPRWAELWCVCPPGRDSRFSEPPLHDLCQVVSDVVPALRMIQDVPLAFLGHSMGALVSWESARSLVESRDPLPVHLFLSAHIAPHIPRGNTGEFALGDRDLIACVDARYGGLPPEIMQYPEVLDMALKNLRADLQALDTHRVMRAPALPIPMTVMGATQDPSVPVGDLDLWREETTSSFVLETFPGNHGYLAAAPRAVVSLLTRRLRASLGGQLPDGQNQTSGER